MSSLGCDVAVLLCSGFNNGKVFAGMQNKDGFVVKDPEIVITYDSKEKSCLSHPN